jgi:hypothetical protein
MHFTASTSCEYELLRYNTAANLRARQIQVLVAGALCGVAAIFFTGILLTAHRRGRKVQRRSQKVMLACAMFDPDGRVLVTTDGVLPSREITDKYNHRTFNDDFDTTHPVFLWIYRVTHNWASVTDLIPKMKSHLNAQMNSMGDNTWPASSQSSAIYDSDTYDDYEILFRELFCIAAASIASSIQFSLDQLGVLYDQIIDTGTLRIRPHNRFCSHKILSALTQDSTLDLEAASTTDLFGKGQLMFVTRPLSVDESHKLLNAGFRFAYVEHVGRNIAHAMQIPLTNLATHFQGLKRYVATSRGAADKKGTWLLIFAMMPKTAGKGFDVVVKQDARDQLPDVPLLAKAPAAAQIAFLATFDGLRVAQILTRLDEGAARVEAHSAPQVVDKENAEITFNLRQAILSLFASLPKEWASDARFYAKPLHAHYTPSKLPSSSSAADPVNAKPLPISHTTTLFAFTAIPDLHTSHLLPLSTYTSTSTMAGTELATILSSASAGMGTTLTRIPRTFFELRHHCCTDNSLPARRQRLKFKREVHEMFEPIFSKRIERGPSRGSSVLPKIRLKKKTTGMSGKTGHTLDQAERGKTGSVGSGSGSATTPRTSGSTTGEERDRPVPAEGRDLLIARVSTAATNASARSSPGPQQKATRPSPVSQQHDSEQGRSSKDSREKDKSAVVSSAPQQKPLVRPSLALSLRTISDFRVRRWSVPNRDVEGHAVAGADRDSPEVEELEGQQDSDLTFVDELVAVTKARFGVGTMGRV